MIDKRLSIHQTNAVIGIDTQKAKLKIQSPPGKQTIHQEPIKLEISSPHGQLSIDSSAAWNALGVGSNIQWMNLIHSQMQSIAAQNIGKIVKDGNRMANIANKKNAFAELAAMPAHFPPIQYTTKASSMNVHVHYQMRAPEIHASIQKPVINYQSQKTQIAYNPGEIDIYLKQKNSIDIQVSQYNLYQ